MPRFTPGDLVVVNGFNAVINSWPDNDEGAFSWTSTDAQGATTTGTDWTQQTAVVLQSAVHDSLENFDADMAKTEAELVAETDRANAAQAELDAVNAAIATAAAGPVEVKPEATK